LDVWLFSVSDIRPDIRQVKSGIRLDTGTKYQIRLIIRLDIRCIPIGNTALFITLGSDVAEAGVVFPPFFDALKSYADPVPQVFSIYHILFQTWTRPESSLVRPFLTS
jgi:hypothetical protein